MVLPASKEIRLTHQFKWRNVIIDEACHYHFLANQTEAEIIAQRLNINQLTKLEADLRLIRHNQYEFSLTGQVQVVYWQDSALTLENIEGQLAFDLDMLLSGKLPRVAKKEPAPKDADKKDTAKKHKGKPTQSVIDVVIGLDEPDYIEEDTISLTEFVVQELSLNLPLSPEYGDNNELASDYRLGFDNIAEK